MLGMCSGLFTHHLDQDALGAQTVELDEVHELPGSKIKPTFVERDNNLVMKKQGLWRRIATLLSNLPTHEA